MITHVALYRFKNDAPSGSAADFATAVRELTNEVGLSSNFSCGPHVPLPADAAVAESVYSFTAVWGFDTVERLDEFSRHPSISRFEREWVRPLVSDLAIANYDQRSPRPSEEEATSVAVG